LGQKHLFFCCKKATLFSKLFLAYFGCTQIAKML
jgi:hypothetical protein